MPTEHSLGWLAQHRRALGEFNNVYVECLQAGPTHPNAAELRNRVVQLIPAAQAALDEADVDLAIRTPPLLPGSYVYTGLANTAFLHEQAMAYGGVSQAVQDLVRLASVKLEQRERELARKRRSPLYWGDRVVSAVLRFPAYLVGKIVGVPTSQIERSPWGLVLRIAELAAAALGVYFGGSAAGWW